MILAGTPLVPILAFKLTGVFVKATINDTAGRLSGSARMPSSFGEVGPEAWLTKLVEVLTEPELRD